MSESTELSLEQRFSVHSFGTLVQNMSREQAQECLLELYQQMLLQQNMYKDFIKQQWMDIPGF